jgi:dTDP-4-amino-4,6-dideoxygalactose transaminase
MKVGRFGDAEVFSGSPTKAFTTVEGGLVTTNNEEIAKKVEIGRNYGHHGDYNCEIFGLSARMSELHAALGLNLLPYTASGIERRNEIAKKYREGLGKLPGVRFQKITAGSLSAYKDFAILIDESQFGLHRDQLAVCLEKENIMTKKYFYPPIHMQDCYPELKASREDFPNTSLIAHTILCLPIFSRLTNEQVSRIIGAIIRIHNYADEIKYSMTR